MDKKMPPDATQTKKRLLDAAFAEFAQHGLAGGRVDRIGATAGVNKRLIYVHFTNKEQLFDLVVALCITRISQAVPFTPNNLPEYAVALFDHLLAYPDQLRIVGWAQLERHIVGNKELESYGAKVDAIAKKRRNKSALEPVDVLALLLGLVTAWFSASPALRELSGEEPFSPDRLARHRAALTAAVQALIRI
jgi:AcrR family transcriptional regulator